LRELIKKHGIIKIKYIEEDNKFFFWKELLQEYSNKKGMCNFIINKFLLPKDLQDQLRNCISDIIRIEINKMFQYINEITNIINENKTLPSHIKMITIDNGIKYLKDQRSELFLYLDEKEEKDEKKDEKKEENKNSLKNRIINRIKYWFCNFEGDSQKELDRAWEIVLSSVRVFVDNYLLTKNIESNFYVIYEDFSNILHPDYDEKLIKETFNYIEKQLQKELNNLRKYIGQKEDKEIDIEEIDIGQKEDKEIKSLFFMTTGNSEFYDKFDSEDQKNFYEFMNDSWEDNVIGYLKTGKLNLQIIKDSYKRFILGIDEFKDEDINIIFNRMKLRIESILKKYNKGEKVENKGEKVENKEKKLCQFFDSKTVEKHIKRSVIECMERIIAMNAQKQKLATRIKIIQEIETVVPRINVEMLEKKIEVKPLYFQIYDVILPRFEKEGKTVKTFDEIIYQLNSVYKDLIINKPKDYEYVIRKLRLISTLKYIKPFINEIEWLSRFLSPYEKMNSMLVYLKTKSDLLKEFKGRWEFPINTNNMEEYIIYLINNLNLYSIVIDIDLPKRENKEESKYYEQYGGELRVLLFEYLQKVTNSDSNVIAKNVYNRDF